MPIDVVSLPDDNLHNLIVNHRKQKATNEPLYLAALREWEVRKGKGLNFDKSLQIIGAAAKERRFISYKELADASGADWSKVHYPIFVHLGNLLEYAHRNNLPLLTAIVVSKPKAISHLTNQDHFKSIS